MTASENQFPPIRSHDEYLTRKRRLRQLRTQNSWTSMDNFELVDLAQRCAAYECNLIISEEKHRERDEHESGVPA